MFNPQLTFFSPRKKMPLAVFERKKVARVLLVLHVYAKTDVAKFSVIFIAYSVAKFHVLFIALS